LCGITSRDGGGSQVAYVTFKDAQALDTALLLSVSLYRHTGDLFAVLISSSVFIQKCSQ